MEGNNILIPLDEYNALRDIAMRAKIANDILTYVMISAYNDKDSALLDAARRTLDPEYKVRAGEVED